MIELHRTGKHDDATKTQSVIPKFTGRSFKVEIYFNRKALKTSDINFRITPSIACYQLELLDLAQKYLQENTMTRRMTSLQSLRLPIFTET